jgi:ATP-binding cassette, subfamily B, bacterial PglK
VSEPRGGEGTLHIVWRWLSPTRRVQLGVLVALSCLGALAELATLGVVLPLIALLDDPSGALAYPVVGALLDGVSGTLGWDAPRSPVLAVTALFGAVVAVSAALRLALIWVSVRLSEAIGHDLSMAVYRKVLHQPYQYHTQTHSSVWLSSVEKVEYIVWRVFYAGTDALVSAVMAVALMAGLMWIDWQLALLAAGLFGVLYGALSRISKARVLENSRAISLNASRRVQAIQEGVGGIRDVLLDGSQAIHLETFRRQDSAVRRARVQNTLWGQTPRYLIEALALSIIAGIAVWMALTGGGLRGALPVLGGLALGALKLIPHFQRIYQGWNSVVGHRGAVEDVDALVNIHLPDDAELRGDPEKLPFGTSLALSGVGFRYTPESPWVFRGVDLVIPKGARVGLSGETGCGKSTLLDLVMGLLPPTEGQITVDGAKLTPETLRHWRARIAHVPQKIFLADASIAANIAFGVDPHAIDMDRVHEAAKRARIHDFVLSLEDGYETLVGEDGVRLSGGQRQRIGIARALYRNADVLILDEATSALDSETEALVMQEIRDLGPDVTVLITAHRMSTLDGCDLLLKMHNGVVFTEVKSEHSI